MLDKLIDRSYFPKVESVILEQRKLGLLRIVLGIVVFVRLLQIVFTNWELYGAISLIHVATLAICLCFIIGLFTPFSVVTLIVLIRRFDASNMSDTLGSSILILFFLLILLSRSGQYYSIDNLLLKRRGVLQILISKLYGILGGITANGLTMVNFVVFSLYAYISFAALSVHIQDEYWVHGLTVRAMLTNSYLTPYFAFFRYLEKEYFLLVQYTSIAASVFQSVFQFIMVPLVFFRLGLVFVKWWGMQFFIISLTCLSLSYLPHIEIALWVAILFPIRIRGVERVEIFYDDYCNLCKRAMIFFKVINFNGKFLFVPISTNQEAYDRFQLTDKIVKSYMAGTCKGQVYIGYDLYVQLVKANPLLWIFYPLFILGKIGGLGAKIYNFIAERRYKYFGKCELSFEDEIAYELKLNSPIKPWGNIVVVSLYFLIVVIHGMYNLPLVNRVLNLPNRAIVNKFIYQSGIELPGVFNKSDLSLGNSWLFIERSSISSSECAVVPISGSNGERLNYSRDILLFKNHNSDLLYFGTSLWFRRSVIRVDDLKGFMVSEPLRQNVERRIKYDYNKTEQKGIVQYRIELRKSKSSIVQLNKPDSERHLFKVNGMYLVVFDGNKFLYK